MLFFVVTEACVLWQKTAIREKKAHKQLCIPAALGSNPPIGTLCAKFKAEEERCDASAWVNTEIHVLYTIPHSAITMTPSVSLEHCQSTH